MSAGSGAGSSGICGGELGDAWLASPPEAQRRVEQDLLNIGPGWPSYIYHWEKCNIS